MGHGHQEKQAEVGSEPGGQTGGRASPPSEAWVWGVQGRSGEEGAWLGAQRAQVCGPRWPGEPPSAHLLTPSRSCRTGAEEGSGPRGDKEASQEADWPSQQG